MREWWKLPSHRRQPYGKTCTENRRRPILRGGDARAVLGPNASTVGFDDLLRDRQSQPGVLSKALVWPVGIKALEYSFKRIRPDARPVVVHHDFHFIAQTP